MGLPLMTHFPSSVLAAWAAYAVGSFANFAQHLLQQNFATNSTLLEPSAALPLIGHLSLTASAAIAEPSAIDATPTSAIADLISDLIMVNFNSFDVFSQRAFFEYFRGKTLIFCEFWINIY
mgnify:CR=1 FL=1